MAFWSKWFRPKWKVTGKTDVRRSAGTNWIGRVNITREGRSRVFQHIFKQEPTTGEIKAMAQQECDRRNSGGTPAGFLLVDKDSGKVLSKVNGMWKDPMTFEVWNMELMAVPPESTPPEPAAVPPAE